MRAFLFTILAALASCTITAHQIPPETGWTVKGKCLKAVDGDTVDIEVRAVIRVRLIDCWSPESKIDDRLPKEKQAAEKKAGQAAKKNLQQLAEGQEVVLHVPIDSVELKDVLTFNRVLGTVWLDGADKSLNEIQVESGHATKEKRAELK